MVFDNTTFSQYGRRKHKLQNQAVNRICRSPFPTKQVNRGNTGYRSRSLDESMKTIASLSAAATILSACGCSSAESTSNYTQDRNELAHIETKPTKGTQMYPILKYTRNQSSDVLLKHEATDDEKLLFKRMDSAVVALTGDADIEVCYEVIVPIGREAGLAEEDSIAFWTRMTFSEFEQ